MLALGTLARILAGPAVGRLADRWRRRREALATAAALSGVIGAGYLAAFGLAPVLGVHVAEASAAAALPPLSDALTVGAAERGGFVYGRVRGAGSAAFVAGTLLSGELIDRAGLAFIVWASSALFVLMAVCAARLPAPAREDGAREVAGAFRALAAIPAYRRLLLVVVLVLGSHALNDTFAVIEWRAAGYGGFATGLLWSVSVVSEVAVFFLVGPWLLSRFGPAACAGLSAGAGALRWAVMATTTAAPALGLAQSLHGLTFALLHLVAMRIIAERVPERLAATAQTLYGAFALGLASAALTFASGYLYASFGAYAYWPMAALCALALPWVGGLRARAVDS